MTKNRENTYEEQIFSSTDIPVEEELEDSGIVMDGAQLFVETHSDHIINGIRVAVKEKSIEKEKIRIAYFRKETTLLEQYSVIDSIAIDENGELSDYPQDFMDEWNNQLLKLI